MRLRQRSTVLLPQPDGPMKAVIWPRSMRKSTSRTARKRPVVHARGPARRTPPRRAGAGSAWCWATSLGAGVDGALAVGGGGGGFGAHGGLSLLVGGGHWCFKVNREATKRAMRVRTKTSTTRVRAAPHARSCAAGERRGGVAEDLGGQRGVGTGEAPARGVEDADGEDERGRLARGPGHGEHAPADDPGQGGRDDDRHRRAERAGAEGHAAVAELVGHQLQHLLGRADDDRQHQAGQREGAGEARLAL